MTLGELFTAGGYLTGALVFWWSARQKGLATTGIGWVCFSGLFAGIVGAKISQLGIQGWPVRVPAEAVLDPTDGGRALLGGLICGWIGAEVAKRRLGIRRSTGDLFALALPAGEAVGRIGCFFNQCCYGVKCSLPWAVYQHGAWRHPTQIYSAVTALALFCVLMFARSRLKREGDLFLLYLAGFGATRFLLEYIRWADSVVFGLSPMQWFCLELMAGSAIAWLIKARKATRTLEVA